MSGALYVSMAGGDVVEGEERGHAVAISSYIPVLYEINVLLLLLLKKALIIESAASHSGNWWWRQHWRHGIDRWRHHWRHQSNRIKYA